MDELFKETIEDLVKIESPVLFQQALVKRLTTYKKDIDEDGIKEEIKTLTKLKELYEKDLKNRRSIFNFGWWEDLFTDNRESERIIAIIANIEVYTLVLGHKLKKTS